MSGTSDLDHYIGGDLTWSDVGDVQPVSDTEKGKQRVLRRLLTNPGSYLWNPSYGAGLPARIGEPLTSPEIAALIQSQMFMEQCVSRTPAPTITVTTLAMGTYQIAIRYTDANTGANVVLAVDPNNPPGKAA